MATYQATVSAPVNIACIKSVQRLLTSDSSFSSVSHVHRYWGKRDTKLILPTNSSLSVTLDQDHLRSTTTSRADPSFEKDRLWLNGKEELIGDTGRMATCIAEMKRLRRDLEEKSPNEPKVGAPCTSDPYRLDERASL